MRPDHTPHRRTRPGIPLLPALPSLTTFILVANRSWTHMVSSNGLAGCPHSRNLLGLADSAAWTRPSWQTAHCPGLPSYVQGCTHPIERTSKKIPSNAWSGGVVELFGRPLSCCTILYVCPLDMGVFCVFCALFHLPNVGQGYFCDVCPIWLNCQQLAASWASQLGYNG